MDCAELPTIEICKGHTIPFWNPPRLPELDGHGIGRSFGPSRYVIGWPNGIVKVGHTNLGRRRWGMFLARGGVMLDLAFYESAHHPLEAEVWLHEAVSRMGYESAFSCKAEAEKYLGNRGAGYTECSLIPVTDWDHLIETAKEVTHATYTHNQT